MLDRATNEFPDIRLRNPNVRVFRASRQLDDLVRCIVASTAIPTLMRAVQLDGTALWNGLYSTNPPIYDLPDVHMVPWGVRKTTPTRSGSFGSTRRR